MTPTELTETLQLHQQWKQGNPDGRCADLAEADLTGANLEQARLPDGMCWWQGGAYGPRRRMIRVLGMNGAVVVMMAGCINGDPGDVKKRLAVRVPNWAGEIGQDAAEQALADVYQLIDLGVAYVTRQASVTA